MTTEFENILRHEMTHYKRKDIIYKWFIVLVSAVHWFNPLMILLRHEIACACELSCDEAVIRNMSDGDKQKYGETLMALSANHKLPAGILARTLCEKRSELKERLICIMKYKKRTIWTIAISVLIALLLTGCGTALGVSNPNTEAPSSNEINNTTMESKESNNTDTATSVSEKLTTIPTTIKITEEVENDFSYFVAEVEVESVKDIESYGEERDMPLNIAMSIDAEFAVNGDNYAIKGNGITIRNGELIIDKQNESSIFALFEDGTAATFAGNEITGQELLYKGCWHCFSGGTLLINNGTVCDFSEDTENNPVKNPRTGIGLYRRQSLYLCCCRRKAA